MGANQKNHKSIDSFLDRIDEHIAKYEQTIKIWNQELLTYYIKEIEKGFISNINKIIKKTPMTKEQSDRLLNLKKYMNEKHNISLN